MCVCLSVCVCVTGCIERGCTVSLCNAALWGSDASGASAACMSVSLSLQLVHSASKQCTRVGVVVGVGFVAK